MYKNLLGENSKIHSSVLIGGTRDDTYSVSGIQTKSNANGDWTKFENGLLICWGTATVTYKGSTWVGADVTFPHIFINSRYNVNLTREYTASFYSKTTVFYENKTERGFTINVRVIDGTGADVKNGYNTEVDWQAIGRWKY